jgi:hypothetical protein
METTEMEKTDFHHGNSDSAKSPIGDEKIRHVPLEAIPDPDDGLSAEERAKIVTIAYLNLLSVSS